MKRLAHPLVRLCGPVLAGVAVTLLRLSGRQVGFVLLYHAVAEPRQPPECEIQPPHPPRLFERQLRHLRRWWHVVDAAELLDAVTVRRRGGRFPVAITFDDDLAEHAATALPILRREGVRATFFVCGASLEQPFSFWWERLQRAVDRALPGVRAVVARRSNRPLDDTAHVRELATAIESMTPEDRDATAAELGALVGPDPNAAGLRAADLRLIVEGGMPIGFHTLRHDPLDSLGDDRIREALESGRDGIESLVGERLDAIAYPHGRADRRVAHAARASGFRHGFSAAGRPVRPDADPLLVPRVMPSYRSAGHLGAHLVLGLLSVSR